MSDPVITPRQKSSQAGHASRRARSITTAAQNIPSHFVEILENTNKTYVRSNTTGYLMWMLGEENVSRDARRLIAGGAVRPGADGTGLLRLELTERGAAILAEVIRLRRVAKTGVV